MTQKKKKKEKGRRRRKPLNTLRLLSGFYSVNRVLIFLVFASREL